MTQQPTEHFINPEKKRTVCLTTESCSDRFLRFHSNTHGGEWQRGRRGGGGSDVGPGLWWMALLAGQWQRRTAPMLSHSFLKRQTCGDAAHLGGLQGASGSSLITPPDLGSTRGCPGSHTLSPLAHAAAARRPGMGREIGFYRGGGWAVCVRYFSLDKHY